MERRREQKEVGGIQRQIKTDVIKQPRERDWDCSIGSDVTDSSERFPPLIIAHPLNGRLELIRKTIH